MMWVVDLACLHLLVIYDKLILLGFVRNLELQKNEHRSRAELV
jgi:hypothetical protein